MPKKLAGGGLPPLKVKKAATPAPIPRDRPRYAVIRDTREKPGQGWHFAPSVACSGTSTGTLKTGDYTLVGHEAVLCVERKGSASEFVGNLYQKRFDAELTRMAAFKVAIVILEFDLEELARWHEKHPKLRRVPRHWEIRGAILARFWEVQMKHPHVQFIFAGAYGQTAASSLFKRVVEKHGV